MGDLTLFDVEPLPVLPPVEVERLSADRRRTIRQRNDLAHGVHPLSKAIGRREGYPLRLHEDENRTCGNCRFRDLFGHTSRSYPKCTFGDMVRATHGAATDVRAWWRGCTDHEYDATAVHLENKPPRPMQTVRDREGRL